MGTEHFAEHCAVCHGAPGVPKGDNANGLYPQPPDLAITAKRYTGGELFWIIKHGIKMTGMHRVIRPASRREHQRRALCIRHSELVLMAGPISRW